MSDNNDPVCKTVKPAHEGALIPDPAHGNFLPKEGAEVVWDHYWIGRETRGEIVIVKPKADGAAETEQPVDQQEQPAA